MSLLDRYLNAVRNHLPADQQDDIVAELGEDLRTRFEERAHELGRPLTEDDEAQLLKPYGRPLLLAARYRPRQHLIGPDLFPYYWTTLKLALAIAFVVVMALSVTFVLTGRPFGDVASLLWTRTFNVALSVFTWVTLVFALVELVAGRVQAWDDWDPRSLRHETRPASSPSRFELGLDLVFSTVFVAFWVALPHSEFLRSLGDSGLEMAPVWAPLYVPVLVVVLVSMAVKAVALVRPELVTFRFVAGLATTVAGIALLIVLLGAGDLVVASASTPLTEKALPRLLPVVNMALRVSFFVAIVVNVVTTALDIRRYARRRRVRFA